MEKVLITTLNSKYIHSSLAIRYLKSFCNNNDENIDMKEFTINMHLDDILIDIYEGGYDLVAFSCYIWNYKEILKLTKDLKKVNPDIKILLGGPEVSYKPKNEIKNKSFIDFIIYGEGEKTFYQLVKEFRNNKNYEKVDGLVYKDNKKIRKNKKRELIKNLDDIPFPYRDDLKGLDHKIIYYESTRGCPFNCSYCLSSTIKGVRFFSIKRVKRDLKFFLDKNVKQVKFVDRTFNIKKEHYFEIIKFINENDNGKTNFHFEVTATLLDKEVINYLKTVRKGLFQLEIGVQTTNKNTLNNINRDIKFKKLKNNVVELINARTMHIHLDLIAGLPYESYGSFLESFDDVYKLKPDKLQLGFLKLLKGSEIRKNSKKYNYVFNDEPPYEVYYNKYISFDQMIYLNKIEDILDIYYNSHMFKNTLDYLIKKYFKKPHKFYVKFYEFWDENNLFKLKHSKLTKYKILRNFYKTFGNNLNEFNQVLKFDYLINKNKKVKNLFNRKLDRKFRNKCHEFLHNEENINKYFPQFINLPAKKIIKKVHFEPFDFDCLKFIKNNFKIDKKEKSVLLFDYTQSTLFKKAKVNTIDIKR